MIAVASAMMVRIALVAISRHLIGIVGSVTFGDLLARRHAYADAGIWPFQCVRRRRRSKGADEHQAGKDVQQASHDVIRSSNADVGIGTANVRSNATIIARLPARRAELRATPGSLRREHAMPIAGR